MVFTIFSISTLLEQLIPKILLPWTLQEEKPSLKLLTESHTKELDRIKDNSFLVHPGEEMKVLVEGMTALFEIKRNKIDKTLSMINIKVQ
jgi:hypothetical protein